MDRSTAGYKKADALFRTLMAGSDTPSLMEAVLHDGKDYEHYLEMEGDTYVVREVAFAKGTDDIISERIVGTFDRDGNRD